MGSAIAKKAKQLDAFDPVSVSPAASVISTACFGDLDRVVFERAV